MELAGLRVMVVEDEALISMILEHYLKELGCKVVTSASRLNDALEKAASVAMDVAVLDINLAGQVSYPVAELLRLRAIPFVFATGYGSISLPLALQGSLVLSKPLDQKRLGSTLLAATKISPV